MMFIKVDFPEPLAPIMATNSPAFISDETPRTACTSTAPVWYTFWICSSLMTAVMDSLLPLAHHEPNHQGRKGANESAETHRPAHAEVMRHGTSLQSANGSSASKHQRPNPHHASAHFVRCRGLEQGIRR